MIWLNFLHFYQPANAEDRHIKEATEKSYLRIIRALEKHPNIKLTLNIAGCLLERWENLGYLNLIGRIKKLINKGGIELTGTAAYHPLLPLAPKKEIVRQIKENEQILKKHFGGHFKPAGFFFPEMAYSEEAGKIVKKLGYKWIILDEIAFAGKLGQVDFNKIYRDKMNGLKIIFRSRRISQGYVPEIISNFLRNHNSKILITATDAELYGLRHEDPTDEFEKLLANKKLKTSAISEFIELNQASLKKISPLPSNWESTEKELRQKRPYALWHNPQNKIQQMLWQLANLACQALKKNKKDKNYIAARWHLVRGLASCTFWWASGRDLRHVFGPVAWSPDEIERGLNDLTRAIRSLSNKKTKKVKLKAEKLNVKIRLAIWEKHWNNY